MRAIYLSIVGVLLVFAAVIAWEMREPGCDALVDEAALQAAALDVCRNVPGCQMTPTDLMRAARALDRAKRCKKNE